VNAWFDKESLSPGQKWEREIRKAIRTSRFFLLLLSKNSIAKRGFYQREIREALRVLEEYPDDEIYLVPVRLDNCNLHFEQLEALHYVDLFPNWDIGFKKIINTFEKHCSTDFDENNQTTPPKTEKWCMDYVEGTSFELFDGIVGTREKPNGHNDSLFPSTSTVILGDSNKIAPFNRSKHTIASWKIPLIANSKNPNGMGFLLLGCRRYHGGLHSPVANDFVDIYLNDNPIDGFEIRIIPEGQTDYFYQRPCPKDIPKLYPFSICENIYAWPVDSAQILTNAEAYVRVRIAQKTKWDIDYVGLMFELLPF